MGFYDEARMQDILEVTAVLGIAPDPVAVMTRLQAQSPDTDLVALMTDMIADAAAMPLASIEDLRVELERIAEATQGIEDHEQATISVQSDADSVTLTTRLNGTAIAVP